jgi:hypothetical protein
MYRITLTLFVAVTISACGGGNSSGDNFNGNIPVADADLKIDAANGPTAAKLSYESAEMNAGLGNMMMANGGLILGGRANVSKALQGQVSKVIDVTTHQAVTIGPQTTPCLVNGSIIVSGELASPLGLSPGDTFTVESVQCDDGVDQIVHGRLELTVESFSGDIFSGLYNLQMSMEMIDFQVITPADTLTSNGGAIVSLDTTQSPQVSASVSGDSMVIDSNSSSETLLAFGSQQTVDAGISPAPYTWSSYGTLDSTQLPGVIEYTTPVTFEGEDVDFPHTGELLVEGDNSSARLIAVDNVNVLIEFDYDGDGTIDETLETTWVDLEG